MMNKLLITGITGKSGLILLNKLIQNWKIIRKRWVSLNLVIRSEEKVKEIREILIESQVKYDILVGDLNNFQYCIEICKNVDTVIHIAGIQLSSKIVEACIKQNVKRVILVHTTGIYSKYKSAGQTYREIDSYVMKLSTENNIELTVLRPTMIYGSITDQNIAVFIKMVDKLKIIPMVNGGHYALQPVNYKDLGEAYYDVLINPSICNGKNYILSGKNEVDLKNIFETIAFLLKKKRIYISIPFGVAYTGAWILYIITIKIIDYREKVQRLCEPRAYGHVEASQDFNYSPISFEEGIKREVEEYISNKKCNSALRKL